MADQPGITPTINDASETVVLNNNGTSAVPTATEENEHADQA
jgi:hypothetical protein